MEYKQFLTFLLLFQKKLLTLGQFFTKDSMEYTAIFEKMDNGWYFAQCEQMPNAITQGKTVAEAKENLQEVIAMLLDIQRE